MHRGGTATRSDQHRACIVSRVHASPFFVLARACTVVSPPPCPAAQVIPYAFTFQEIPLFLAILNGILLGMLLGLCIVAQLVQPYLERLWLRLALFVLVPPHRKLHAVVVKNLSAHSGRNKKTSEMFVICLAFLVFASCMFALQSASLVDNLRVFAGADIQVMAPKRDPAQHLAEREMAAFLQDQIERRKAGDKNSVSGS